MNDHTKESQEKKLEIIFYQSRYKSRRATFLENRMNGPLKLLISSIRWFRESLITGWATMDQKK